MRTAAVLLLAGSALAQFELNIERHQFTGQGVKLPPGLIKRLADAGVDTATNLAQILTNSAGGGYYANLTIGSPPQLQVVQIDTGSSDLWVNSAAAAACQNTNDENSCRGGTFDKSKSSTYKQLQASPAFNISYLDGSGAIGSWSQETLGFGSVAIPNVRFGLAEIVNDAVGNAFGIVGIGYSYKEALQKGDAKYPNIPEVFKSAGLIDSRAYSIWLNSVNNGQGSVLFGGVDTSKFTGQMQVLNLLRNPTTRQVSEFYTTITDIDVTVSGTKYSALAGGTDDQTAFNATNPALPAILDTGSGSLILEKNAYNAILKRFPYVDSENFVPCKYRDAGDSLTFTFGGKVKINIPATEFIVPVYDRTTRKSIPYPRQNDFICRFMVTNAAKYDGRTIVGDSILRSMYLTFDLDKGQVGIAQANTNPGNSNIVKLSSQGIGASVSGSGSAPQQSNSIAAGASITQAFVATTIATAVGTATGIDAVLTEFRPAGTAVPGVYNQGANSNNGGSGSGSNGSNGTSGKNAAGVLAVPGIVSLMMVAGAAMLL